jgi:hypothetical protein
MMDKYIKGLLTAVALSVLALPLQAEEKVWYCEMKAHVDTNLDGVTSYERETFKMKVTPREIVFGSGGYFDNTTMPIVHWGSASSFRAATELGILYFSKNILHYGGAYLLSAFALTARCDDF